MGFAAVRHRSAWVGLAALVGGLVVSAGGGPAAAAAGATITVPGQEPSVQAAINAAVDGDTVLVSAGTYHGNVDFLGKAIRVESVSGAGRTTLVGDGKSPVVAFHSGEDSASVLEGFTIRGGVAAYGGGIYVSGASPTITADTMTANQACYGGAGVYVSGGAASFTYDTVSANQQEAGCGDPTTGGGGGIYMTATVGAEVANTTVSSNSWSGTSGGGIYLFNPGTVRLFDTTVQRNSPGGVSIFNNNTATVVQDLVTDNSSGPALNLSTPGKGQGPVVDDNTVVAGPSQTALVVGGADSGNVFENDIFESGFNQVPAVECLANASDTPPVFVTDLAWAGGPAPVAGTCVGSFAGHGNLRADPKFVQSTNGYYQLSPGSPAVNAGTNNAPGRPPKDFVGNPRIVGGRVDLGVYEFQASTT